MASVFSGKAGRNAAIWTATQAANQRKELYDIYGQGKEEALGYLGQGFQPTLDALNQYYGQQRADLGAGLDQATATLRGGLGTARGDLTGGYGAAIADANRYYGQGTDALGRAAAGFDPLIQRGMSGYDMYLNSLGLNGAAGNQAARDAFQTGPGYQFAVDEATRNAQRSANRVGGLYSRNTMDAVTRLGQNLANQEYGNWQTRLGGFQGAAQNAVSGQAGVLSNLANLYGQQGQFVGGLQQAQGRDLATLEQQIASAIASGQMGTASLLAQAASNQGGNIGSLYQNQGQAQANVALGHMGNLANATNAAYNTIIPAGQQGLMAGQQAAQNRMGAMMGGFQMGGQLLGMGTGGGGTIGGSIFKSLFGS